MVKRQLLRLAAWASQTVNVWLLLGHHDQTVSARCFINREKTGWRTAYRVINAVFFWQTTDHCRESFIADLLYAEEVVSIYNDLRIYDGIRI